jgi:methyl-accepting chemotaxis protein
VGEQGKGFAVVASEVRSLAGRSATAAKEIKGLVLDSVQKVEHGTKLVNSSGEELKQIVASVDRVAGMVAEISSAAQEQSAGIEQINKAVSQMDEITQKNAALVEESSASSESMAQKAGELKEAVSRFKIDETNLHLSTTRGSSFSARSASDKKTEAFRPRSHSSKPARKVVGGSRESHFDAEDRPGLKMTKSDDIL